MCWALWAPDITSTPSYLWWIFPQGTHGLRIPSWRCLAAPDGRLDWQSRFLLPRPCDITQTLSPLPTKIHLCSHANLKIHHPAARIETMTIMTARDGSRNKATRVPTGNFCPRDWFPPQKMKLSAEVVHLCEGGAFKCILYPYREAVCLGLHCFWELDGFNEATEEFLLLNFLLW